MELKKGYKQTDIGIIPKDWSVTKVGEVCNIIGRIGYRGYTKEDIVKKNYGAIALSPSNIKDDEIEYNNLTYISWFKYEESPEIKIFENDIILVKTGSTYGKTCLVKNLKTRATINPQLVVLKNITINNVLLSYLFKNRIIQNQISKTIVGGAIPTLSQKQVASYIFPLPSTLIEQKAIAQILTDTDQLIQNLKTLIAKKKAIKQGAMQELLTGKKRLKGFSGVWEIKTLGDIAFIKTGSKNNQDKVSDGQYPFFVRSQTIERINSYSYDCEAILIPGEGGIGSIFHYLNEKFDVHQRVYVISQFSEKVFGKYVYLYMKEYFGEHAMKNSVKATVDSLRLPTFQVFELHIPKDIEEQKAIAQILSDMDLEIEALEIQLQKTQNLKQGMMQELLTGRIRLIDSTNENLESKNDSFLMAAEPKTQYKTTR
jgi:type I restriction enzyme S subunit